MKKPTKTKKLYLALPDDFIDRAMALQEQAPGGGCLWRERGAFVAEATLGVKHGYKMLVYQSLDRLWRKAESTVRNYERYSEIFGDIVDEYPSVQIAIEDCKDAITEGKLREIDPDVVMIEAINEGAKKYDGQLRSRGSWKALIQDLRAGKKTDDGEDVIGRIRAAGSCIATAMKRANGKAKFATLIADLESVAKSLEDLLDKAESVK
jgi:hypothetical protein